MPCTGCQKRKEFLKTLVAKGKIKAREMAKRTLSGSNAARRVIRRDK